MNRRLQQFLEFEQLSPSKLADMMGIQRSGISHILSGRNKPSFEFISRFLSKFPNVNADWLITGNGKPYKNSDSVFSTQPPLPSWANSTPQTIQNLQPSQKSISPSFEEASLFPDDFIENEEDNDIISDSYPDENAPKVEETGNIAHKKSVKRITIFYSDGSFEELYSKR